MVLSQCTNLLQTKLKQQATWETVENAQDGIVLIALIKTVIHHFEDQKFLPLALYNAKLNLYNFWQQNLSNDDYLHKFNNLVNVAILYNGQVHDTAVQDLVTEDKHSASTDYDTLGDDKRSAIDDAAHELYCATMFIVQADKQHYGKLCEDLENTYTQGNKDYPKMMVQAFKLINEFKHWQLKATTPDVQSTAFSQQGNHFNSESNED